METTIHTRSQVLRELEIMVPEAEVNAAFDLAYRDIRPKMALPGFRAGKAPISLIKKMHGESIEGDTLEKIAQEKFKQVVEEQKIEPIGTPVMTDLHRHHGEGAHFKISYEVKPEIVLANFEGTEIEYPTYTVSDTDVEDRIHYLRFNYSEKAPTDTVADLETIVGLTFTERTAPEGEEAKTEQTTVYLKDPQIVSELRDALVGKKVGDMFDIDLPRTDTETKELMELTINVLSAEKVTLPEMTEEFCKKLSRDKSATELEVRILVRQELEENAKRRSQEAMESLMVNALLSKHDFLVPRTYTYVVIDSMIAEAKEENKRRGYPEEYGLGSEEEYRKAAWGNAEMRAKWLLLRDKLVEAMNISASEEDLTAMAERDAEQYGIAKENLLKYYLSNEEIKERIKSEKLVAELKNQFILKEKPAESK